MSLDRALRKNRGTFIGIAVFVLIVFFVLGVGKISDSGKVDRAALPYGDDVIEMTYFHWNQCPHCHKQNAFHEVLYQEFPNLKIIEHELSDPDFQERYIEVANQIKGLEPDRFPGTPTSVIGTKFNTGYSDDSTTGARLRSLIQEEQDRIDANWDDSRMIRTMELRAQLVATE